MKSYFAGPRGCPEAVFLDRRPCSGLSILLQIKPSTGESCVGDPHARFGGEGFRNQLDFLTPIDYRAPSHHAD